MTSDRLLKNINKRSKCMQTSNNDCLHTTKTSILPSCSYLLTNISKKSWLIIIMLQLSLHEVKIGMSCVVLEIRSPCFEQ